MLPMTREEFEKAFNVGVRVKDRYGFRGKVTSVNLGVGIIHYTDDKKGSNYGRHYSELEID